MIHLFLLQANGISMNLDKVSFENLLAVLIFGAVLIAMVFTHGITFKWGNKEISVGGIKRLLSKKDEDVRLKESLKRFADDIDNEIHADLSDLVEDMDSRLENVLLKEHCYFTMCRFTDLVKSELYKRISRNNLKEKLCIENKEKYVDKILSRTEERYELFHAKAADVLCGDTYSHFSVIRESVRKELAAYFDESKRILISGMKKKITKYEAVKPEFKTDEARKFCCDDCIAKNKLYIKNLVGV